MYHINVYKTAINAFYFFGSANLLREFFVNSWLLNHESCRKFVMDIFLDVSVLDLLMLI